MVKND
jgi:nucleoside-diphosphate-sugar epimerase